MPLLSLKNVEFAWPGAPALLRIPEFQIEAGEHVFLRGPSGSGKSTLLGLIAGVLTADSGQIEFAGEDLANASNAKRDRIRARDMGVIFQLFNLLPYLSVKANVTLPCKLSAERRKRVAETGTTPDDEARRLLDRLGLNDDRILNGRVTNLSVGQQQRVAVARALMGRPKLIIADEPTSALDTKARDAFLELLQEESAAAGSALLFVSHDEHLGTAFSRIEDLETLNTIAAEARA